MNIEDIIKNKLETVEMSDDKLVKDIAGTEVSIFNKVIELLRTFSTKAGKFVEEATNSKILLRLSNEIFDVFEKSTYKPKVEKFFLDFDKVDALNAEMHEGLSGVKIKDLGLTTSKREAINALSKNLLNKATIESNLINPLRRIMYRGITTGASFSDVEFELRQFIKGDKKTRGYLSRYVGQIARDSLLQYDGLVNQTIADEFEFDAFQITNSLIKSSRSNCVQMINASGRFKSLAVSPGVYLIKDIDKIIKIAKNRPGWNKLTTVSNYLQIRNGHNCRHQFIGFRLGTEAEGTLKKLTKSLEA